MLIHIIRERSTNCTDTFYLSGNPLTIGHDMPKPSLQPALLPSTPGWLAGQPGELHPTDPARYPRAAGHPKNNIV